MKKALSLLVVTLSLISCATTYTVPVGYKTCRKDRDCPVGYYCGFVAVDTYAVCKNKTF